MTANNLEPFLANLSVSELKALAVMAQSKIKERNELPTLSRKELERERLIKKYFKSRE